MSLCTFREQLKILEAEYARLEAENSGLRSHLAASIVDGVPHKCLGENLPSYSAQQASDVEEVLPFEFGRRDEMSPSSNRVCSANSDSGAPQRNSPEKLLHQQTTCDVEASLPAQVFQQDCDHLAVPVVPEDGACDFELRRSLSSEASDLANVLPCSLGASDNAAEVAAVPLQRSSSRYSSDSVCSAIDEGSDLRPSQSAYTVISSRPKSLFSCDTEIKAKIRQTVMDSARDVTEYYKTDGYAQAIARHFLFESATLLTISINSIWIAIETDHNHKELLVDADVGFQLVENFFCMYFFAELLIRFAAFEYKSDSLRDAWFVFDAVLVVMMVLETWVFFFVGAILNISAGNVSVLRVVRLLRLTRMARIARLLRSVPELMILIKGLAAAARSVLTTLAMLLILVYIFAIAFTQLLRSTDAGLQFFPNVIESMNTLWRYAMLLNEVTYLSRQIRASSPYTLLLLDVFILAASFTVLNMLIGVLCAVVNAIAIREKETTALHFVKTKIEQVFHSLGIDPGQDCVSRQMFRHLIEHPEGVRAIRDLGVDVVQLLDMADHIFQSEDMDGDFECLDKELSFGDFMDMINDLRGANFATVKDIMQLRAYIRREISKSLRHQEGHLTQCIGGASESVAAFSPRLSEKSGAKTPSRLSFMGERSIDENSESLATFAPRLSERSGAKTPSRLSHVGELCPSAAPSPIQSQAASRRHSQDSQ